jgi:arginine N-succinyltransferase
MMNFINLPSDEEIIRNKIDSSIRSFKHLSSDFSKNYYIFVLEDYKKSQVLGVSMIHAQHGTEEEPHFFLSVGQEAKFSQTINTGFVHGTLKLGLDINGPTEIGGLILHPKFRGHSEKLGKQLSFVRFLFMGIHPERFKATVHSELMPPFDKNGNSPLWEAIGRRFMNMNYQEADLLSRNNKEFILSLFPSENIYQTLLPMEAREAIGKVGKDTEPVRKMLESIGFKYTYEVDPFDGGPHYRCLLNEIKPIREKIKGKITSVCNLNDLNSKNFLVALEHKENDFFALKTRLTINGNGDSIIDTKIAEALKLDIPTSFSAIPID